MDKKGRVMGNKRGKGLGGIMGKDGKRVSVKGWERGKELRFGKR